MKKSLAILLFGWVLCCESIGQVVPSIQTLSEFHVNPQQDLRPFVQGSMSDSLNGGVPSIDGPVIRQDYSSDVSRTAVDPIEVKSDWDLEKEEVFSFAVERGSGALGTAFGEDIIGETVAWGVGDVVAAWTGTMSWTNLVPVDTLADGLFSEGVADAIKWGVSGPIGITIGIIFNSSSTAGPEIDELPYTPPSYTGNADSWQNTTYQPLPPPPPPPDPCNGDPCCGDPCCGDPCCGDPCCGDPCCEDPDLCDDAMFAPRAKAKSYRMEEIRLIVRSHANTVRLSCGKRNFTDGRTICFKFKNDRKQICLTPRR